MKFIVAFVAIVAVAVANPLKPSGDDLAELESIMAAINSPNTDPATAALLEQQVIAIITEMNPIAAGTPIVEFPMPDGGAVTAEEPAIVAPTPVIQPSPAESSPLVQIIVNVNKNSVEQ